MCSTKKSTLTPVNRCKVQYRSEELNKPVKEESATESPTPVVYPEQASISKVRTIGENPSNQMLNEGDVKGQVTPIRSSEVTVSKKRNKRSTGADATIVDSPDWLPKGWITETKCRETGSTAGTRDKYYFDPVSGHRFRSKPDVLRYLHTGEIMKKQKSKLLGSGKSESQRFPQPSVDSLILQVPDVNSSSGVPNNLKIEINLVSVPTYAYNDVDESISLQNRKPYMPMTNGFNVETMQRLEVPKATVQDQLPEENNKRESMNTEGKKDKKRKCHPILDTESCKEENECANHGMQQSDTIKILTPDYAGNKLKRRKQNDDHLAGATASPMVVESKKIPDNAVQGPSEASLAFLSVTFARDLTCSQEQKACSLDNSVKQDATDDFNTAMEIDHVPQTVQECATEKPPEGSILPIQGQTKPIMLSPTFDGILYHYSQPSCSATPESSKVVSFPDSPSPRSVLQAKQPFKSQKRSKKLKVSPQEMKKRLVALGRKLCRKVTNPKSQSPQTSVGKVDLKS